MAADLKSARSIAALESHLAAESARWPLGARVAARLARSKRLLAERSGPTHLSVVVPLYAEQDRLRQPRDHPRGEGLLDRKIGQLQWLCGDLDGVSWELILVDDGCPQSSGSLAREALARRHPHVAARVLFVAEALQAKHPALNGLRSTDESRKGGAVQLGLWEAAASPAPGQVILYTDADLSTHLGQAGLLVDALRDPGTQIAAGSRRDPASIVVKEARRSARGRLFLYLWKQLVPRLAYVDDTQCGFKALRPKAVSSLLCDAQERGFAFDLELLMRCEHLFPGGIEPVPVAWIDSPAASTTTAADPYLGMLRSVVALSRTYFTRDLQAEAFASVVRSFDEATWQTAIDTIAPRLAAIPPSVDRIRPVVSPRALGLLSS